MPEPLFLMRGLPPWMDAGFSPQMVEDLDAIVALPVNVIEQVADVVASAAGFLGGAELTSLLQQNLPKETPVDSVRRVILNLELANLPRLFKFLRTLCEEESEEFPLTEEKIGKLEALLPKLLKPAPALARFRKAELLAKITGQPLEEIQLICDLRPVFDESREQIEGLLPYTRLKIVATGGNGFPSVFEVELSAQQVADLAEKAKKATTKLKCLRERINNKWLPNGIPDIPLTREPKSGD